MRLETKFSNIEATNIIVLAILISFSIACLLFQIKGPIKLFLSRLDKVGVLPYWSFFAPIPGTTDYRILYRDYDFSNQVTDWIELDMLYKNNRKYDFLWNPAKYYQKGLIDIIQLLRADNEQCENKELVQFSWSYLALLQIIMKEPIEKFSNHREFIIINSSGFGSQKKMKTIFISNKHKI